MSIALPLQKLKDSVPFLTWYRHSPHPERAGAPDAADFLFGNPHDMPLPGYVAALAKNVVPQDKDWFAYKLNEPYAVEHVASSVSRELSVPCDAADVIMTSGGFAAINTALRALVEAGDEVIYISPPWFFYDLLIRATGATAKRVSLSPPAFALDLDALAQAITPKTRAVLVNTPHNPTGRVFTDAELSGLGKVLDEASAKHGRPIVLLSDEAYRRIVFDGRQASSPARFYARTLILYSYGKQLLAPGQRIGYLATPRAFPEREELRESFMLAQSASGFTFPNAVLQRSLSEIAGLCVDVAAMQRRRDVMLAELTKIGYEVTRPEGTFYFLLRVPNGDDLAFASKLAERDCFVLPGALIELPGWVRLSLTANDRMVERGIAQLRAVF